MSDDGIKSTWRCAACGRENLAAAAVCSLCLAPQSGTAATGLVARPAPGPSVPAADEDYPRPLPMSVFQRRLPGATATAIVFVCLVLAPLYGAGLALLIVLLPALIYLDRRARMVAGAGRGKKRTFAVVLTAVVLAVLVVGSTLITFVGVCFPTGTYAIMGMGGEGYAMQVLVWVGGLIGGLFGAVAVSYVLVRLMFRRGKRREEPWEPPHLNVRL